VRQLLVALKKKNPTEHMKDSVQLMEVIEQAIHWMLQGWHSLGNPARMN
jgi:hypothetical protein